MYHDTNRDPWKLDKRWEDLSPKEWVEVYAFSEAIYGVPPSLNQSFPSMLTY